MIEKSFDVGGIICWWKSLPPRTARVPSSAGRKQVRVLVGSGSVSDYPTYQDLARSNFPQPFLWPGITSGLPVIRPQSSATVVNLKPPTRFEVGAIPVWCRSAVESYTWSPSHDQ